MATQTKDTAAIPHAPRSGTKLRTVLKQLLSAKGTTLDRLVKATGWQAHTVRAALTGLRKRGYVIERTSAQGGKTRYAIRKG